MQEKLEKVHMYVQKQVNEAVGTNHKSFAIGMQNGVNSFLKDSIFTTLRNGFTPFLFSINVCRKINSIFNLLFCYFKSKYLQNNRY